MKRIFFYLFMCLLCVACEPSGPQPPAEDNQTEQETPATPQEPQEEEKPAPPEELPANANGHAFVDLGLSVKWASYNVGANKPEEYGNYFAWGEVTPTDDYSWEAYKWCESDWTKLTKYCVNADLGVVDNKKVLELADDAARANWGGDWRMPTVLEQDELREQCTWQWTVVNGVNGYKVISSKNGNFIFLPAAGWENNGFISGQGTNGAYWSASIVAEWPSSNAEYISFYDKNVIKQNIFRYFGQVVRAVLP